MTNTDKALLLAEWSCPSGGTFLLACPICRGLETHQPDCAMDLALSERGYCARVDRDRGRTFIASLAQTVPPPPAAHGDSASSDPNFDADPDDGGD